MRRLALLLVILALPTAVRAEPEVLRVFAAATLKPVQD